MKLLDYIKETRVELKHVSWPTRRQTLVFTAVVIVISILTALFLGAFDFLFTKGIEKLISK
ncbi:MAG: Preprotein translocase, SecE subunit [Parcubacteria group bacterium GW2011_GWA2_47_21]|nr:MAG: Preprotein translocase, SecE subunit [Parcubacteria group bacterium GW2011_GWA2_47_21]